MIEVKFSRIEKLEDRLAPAIIAVVDAKATKHPGPTDTITTTSTPTNPAGHAPPGHPTTVTTTEVPNRLARK